MTPEDPAKLYTPRPMQKAWVVFSDKTDLPLLKWLRSGFRHCFLIMHDGTQWITVDPMAGQMDILAPCRVADWPDFPDWFGRQTGFHVLSAPLPDGPGSFWFPGLITCVTVIKRILGLRSAWIQTPWQLYRHLKSHSPHAPHAPHADTKGNANGQSIFRTAYRANSTAGSLRTGRTGSRSNATTRTGPGREC